MGQADRLELRFPPGHPAWWWWWRGGGIFPFISSPSTLKWAPSCPWGAHTWSPAFSLQSSSHSPRLSPAASFPTSPLPLQSCQSLAKAQAGAFDPRLQGQRAGQPALPGQRAPSRLQPHTHGAVVPASLGAEARRRGSTATSPHGAQPMGGSPSRQPSRQRSSPGYSQSHSAPHQLRCWRGEGGVFAES